MFENQITIEKTSRHYHEPKQRETVSVLFSNGEKYKITLYHGTKFCIGGSYDNRRRAFLVYYQNKEQVMSMGLTRKKYDQLQQLMTDCISDEILYKKLAIHINVCMHTSKNSKHQTSIKNE